MVSVITSLKTCNICGETLDGSYFYKNHAKCKVCHQSKFKTAEARAKAAQYKRDHKYPRYEKPLESMPDKTCISCGTSGKATLFYRGCSRCRKCHNKEVMLPYGSLRRSRIRNCDGKFTMEEWNNLKHEYGYKCLRCGIHESISKLTVDHVIPISLGGSNYISNIQPLCGSCNSKKKTKTTDYRMLVTGDLDGNK